MTEAGSGLPDYLAKCRSKGWAAFPVRGKVPLTKNGFKDASPDPEQWARWGKEHPGCGWAAPTGEQNGFDVLDADTPEAVAEGEARLPMGPRVRTGGGGMHFYVRHVPGGRNWAKRLPGFDYRGRGDTSSSQAASTRTVSRTNGSMVRWNFQSQKPPGGSPTSNKPRCRWRQVERSISRGRGTTGSSALHRPSERRVGTSLPRSGERTKNCARLLLARARSSASSRLRQSTRRREQLPRLPNPYRSSIQTEAPTERRSFRPRCSRSRSPHSRIARSY
jgi:hypothetical protein